MSERLNNLIRLKNLVETGNSSQVDEIRALEPIFLGSNLSHGCNCKTSGVLSNLQVYWHNTGQNEYNTLNNGE